MESSRNLHESSFSHGWTRSEQPCMDQADNRSLGHSFNAQDATSFIEMEMDPDVFSMRWPSSYNSDFTLPCDQTFSHGIIATSHTDSSFERSVSTDSSKSFLSQRNQCTLTEATRPVSVNSSPLFYSAQSTPFSSKSPLLRSCSESSKKLLLRYMCFLMPLCRKMKEMHFFSWKPSCRKSASVAAGASRRMSSNSAEWCHGNADTAVYDAILYCKRSIGQDL